MLACIYGRDMDRVREQIAHNFRKKSAKVYEKNNQFWHELSQTAVHVSVADEAPSKWDMAVDSLKYGVTHLPDTLSHVAGKGADVVAGAAHTAGRIVNEAGRGLFGGLGTPLMIGGGLLGVYLLTRSRDRRGDEP